MSLYNEDFFFKIHAERLSVIGLMRYRIYTGIKFYLIIAFLHVVAPKRAVLFNY